MAQARGCKACLDQGGGRACCRAERGDVPSARVVQADGQRWQPLHTNAPFGVPPRTGRVQGDQAATMVAARGGAGRAPCMLLLALRPLCRCSSVLSAQTGRAGWAGREGRASTRTCR